jgi:hypothetical protein
MSTYLFELGVSGISKGNDEGNKLFQLAKKCPKVAPNVILFFLKAKILLVNKMRFKNYFKKIWCLSWLKFFSVLKHAKKM